MEKELFDLISDYNKGCSDKFVNFLNYFNNSIKFYSKKLNYYCAETDLIIFLILLVRKINLKRFNSQEQLEYYIKISIKREYIRLSKLQNKYNFIK